MTAEWMSVLFVQVVQNFSSKELVVEDKLVAIVVPVSFVFYQFESHTTPVVLLYILLTTPDSVWAVGLVTHRPQPDVVGTFIDYDCVSAAIAPIFIAVVVQNLGMIMIILEARGRRRLRASMGVIVITTVVVRSQDARRGRREAGNGVEIDMH